MNPTPLYRAAIDELENILSPRVVSRSLKEGMAQTGAKPDTVGFEEIEKILKGPVYRHLQVTMPIEEAKQAVSEILRRLEEAGGTARASAGGVTRRGTRGNDAKNATPAPLDGQREELEELKRSMKPFNLYFEWPEVQKLRTQIRLLETEQESGREAAELLADAREGLRVVTQKLEDALVIQARDLGELESLLEKFEGETGIKIRRLENLLGHLRGAQEQRQLAPAEIERARKLATDLRKEQESAAASADELLVTDTEPDASEKERASAQADDRLLKIDLESERVELAGLEKTFAGLTAYRPQLRDQLSALSDELAEGKPVGDALGSLRAELEAATESLRNELNDELREIASQSTAQADDSRAAELRRAVEIALGVLENSLPDVQDMRRIRDLSELLASTQVAGEESTVDAEAVERRMAELGELRTLESEISRFAGSGVDGYEELRSLLDEAQVEQPGPRLQVLLDEAWLQLEALRSAVEQRLSRFDERLDAATGRLAHLEKLNSEGVSEASTILRHLDGQRSSVERISLGLKLELEASLQRAEELLAELQKEFDATTAVADTLVSGNFIDGMLGLLDAENESAGGDADQGGSDVDYPLGDEGTVRSGDGGIDDWIDSLLSQEGVNDVLVFGPDGSFLAGGRPELGGDAGSLLVGLLAEFGGLGEELSRGRTRLATIETAGGTLVAGQRNAEHFLALTRSSMAANGVVRRLQAELSPNESSGSGTQVA